jgi:hypothetical protein
MHLEIVSQGYGLKGKSRWVADTLEAFLDQSYWDSIHAPNGWKRVLVDSEIIRILDPRKDFAMLPRELYERTREAAIEAAWYGLHQRPPIILQLRAPAVVRSAIMWGIATTR